MGYLRLASCACIVATTNGFTPAAAPSQTVAPARAVRGSVPLCDASVEDATFSRRAALAGVAGMVIGIGSPPAFAGYVTSLGIETTLPKDAEIDEELLGTSKVQDSIKSIAGYKAASAALKKQFDADTDVALIPAIRKDFDFSKLRDDLNTAATVFDDTTQLTIDRLSRS